MYIFHIYICCFIIFIRNNLPQSEKKSYNHMSLLSIILGVKENDGFPPREKSSDEIISIRSDGE